MSKDLKVNKERIELYDAVRRNYEIAKKIYGEDSARVWLWTERRIVVGEDKIHGEDSTPYLLALQAVELMEFGSVTPLPGDPVRVVVANGEIRDITPD